ncbi:acyl carrier protein [Streptomyces prasinopilosus]|uniref:Acyl carrier protein n=1 Tax=Streptomyces prasinopilosus TaxID=67344 RepID=A0A1G7AME9_9ACTN|nr:acyl carrier protein [Streptomyces prasinopilosus]SDE16029.1 acyl carrier protein [Streptomyces prasinopilosus]
MNREEAIQNLALVVSDVASVDPAEVTEEKTFLEDLDIDSLELVELGVTVEEKFSVKIPDDVLGTLKTVGAMADFIAQRA